MDFLSLSILGEKFLSRERGTVRFRFGSRIIEATIIDWASIGILAEMASDISGMRRTVGTVAVQNHLGRSDTHSTTLLPIEVTEGLTDSLYYRCGQHDSWSGTEALQIAGLFGVPKLARPIPGMKLGDHVPGEVVSGVLSAPA